MNTSAAVRYDVKIKSIGPMRVASIHGLVSDIEHISDEFDNLYLILEEYVESNGKAAGPHMATYHDAGTGPRMLNMHVELAIPYDGPIIGDEQVRVYEMPGVDAMASVIHKGRFEEIHHAYSALFTWVQDNGYRPAGPMRDVYLNCGEGDSPDYITEVQVPVAR
jgi:effector-binding domain-containing protein